MEHDELNRWAHEALGRHWTDKRESLKRGAVAYNPDYCTDLNAAAELEAFVIEKVGYECYIDKLTRQVHYRGFCATAEQRVRACKQAMEGDE